MCWGSLVHGCSEPSPTQPHPQAYFLLAMDGFKYPKIHSFPPFYTKQRNATILETQLAEWCQLILQYCQYHRIYRLGVSDGAGSGLFANEAIDRRCLAEFRRDILNHLVHKLGRAAYVLPKTPDYVVVYWCTLQEWAAKLQAHVDGSGQAGSVLTVYELTQLDESPPDFRGMDPDMFARVVDVLVKQGRAQIIKDGGVVDAVKFA